MRTSDEKFLVGVANDWINRLGICHAGLMPMFGPFEAQVRHTHNDSIHHMLSGLNPAKLGTIIGLRPSSKEGYEAAQFLQTYPGGVIVDSTISSDGPAQLVALALPVVIAAMYDIMATETTPVGCKRSDWAKPAMKNFIQRHRKKR